MAEPDRLTLFTQRIAERERARQAANGLAGLQQDLQAEAPLVEPHTGGLPGLSQDMALIRRGLNQAREEKQSGLAERRGNWAAQMGLTEDSPLHTPANMLASGVSLGRDLLSGVLASPFNAVSGAMEKDIPDEARDALVRYEAGQASEDDMTVLQRHEASRNPTLYQQMVRDGLVPDQTAETYRGDRASLSNLDRLQIAGASRMVAGGIRDSLEVKGASDPTNRTRFTQELAANSNAGLDRLKAAAAQIRDGDVKEGLVDAVSGLTEILVTNTQTLLNNPKAVLEVMAEQVPQLALASASGPAYLYTMASGGADLYRQGYENYLEEHDGQHPPEDVREHMAMNALGYVGSMAMGDSLLLKFMSPATVAGQTVSTGAGRAAANVASRGTAGSVTEYAQEGAQTYFEGEATNTPASLEDINRAAVLGAGAGGGFAGGAQALNQVAGTSEDHQHNREVRRQELLEQRRVHQAALDSGDVSALLDPEQPSYAPSTAMEVLVQRVGNNELGETERQAAREQANQIVSDLSERAQQQRKEYNQSAAGQEDRLHMALTNQKAKLEALPADAPASQRGEIQSLIRLAERRLLEMEGDPAEVKRQRQQDRARIERTERELENVTRMYQGLERHQAASQDQIEELVSRVESSEDRQAAEQIIRLAMESPESLSPERLDRLVASESNAFTSTQRDLLRRFSVAQRAANVAKGREGVRNDVFNGGDGFIGINQYQERFRAHLKAGKPEQALSQLQGLRAFAQQHEGKLATAQAGIEQIRASNGQIKRIDFQFDPNEGWVPAGRFLTKQERESNGALFVTEKGSARLLDDMAAEAEAARTAAEAIAAAYTIATTQQANNDTQQEVADEATVSPEAPAAEPVAENPEPEAQPESAAEPTEPSPAADESVDAEAVDEATGLRYDPQTGEVLDAPTTDATPEQNNDPALPGEGQLTQLDGAGDRSQGPIPGAAFKTVNLVREYLRQDSRDLARRVTKRPLVEIRDFLSALQADKGLAQKFVSEELTQAQQDLVSSLTSRLAVWNETIHAGRIKWNERSPEFRYQDYIGYFRDEQTGEFDENVLTAVSSAMYGWLADNASLRYHDAKGVNRLLGRQTKAPVSADEFRVYGAIGHRQNYMLNDLGRRAAEALGLTADRGVPQDVLEKVQGALGGRAMAAMLHEGLLELTVISEAEAARISDRDINPRAQEHTFVRVPVKDSDVGRIAADEIVESVKGTQSLLPKLFGVEDRQAPPSFKPVPFKNRKPKRSQMAIPKSQEKLLEQYNKTAYSLRDDTWGVWSALDEDTRVLIAGGVDLTQPTHVANNAGAQGRNDSLRREMRSLEEFVTTLSQQPDGTQTPFYLDWEVWKMGRMGVRGSVVNPQSSKIHRHLVKQAGWDHTVQLDNSDGSLDQFWLGVADALGIKTDSQLNATSIADAQNLAADPIIEAGVIAIMKQANNETLTPNDQQAIVAAVRRGGEAMHSFDGLLALARFTQASEAGETEFTHSLTREIDGKTNGPMLTQWLMGAADNARELLDVVIRGGFFSREDGAEHIGEWAQDKNNLDLYQMVAKALNQVRAESLAERPKRLGLYEAIDFFVGKSELDGKVTKYGRNLVKTPVTALNFGSATSSVVQSMGKEFVQAIHDKIEKVARMSDVTEQEAERQALVQHLNAFLRGDDPVRPLNPSVSIDALLKYELKGKALELVMGKYSNTFGRDIKTTLDSVFAPLIERRNTVNQAASTAFALYDAAYRHERQKLLRELMAAGDVATETQKASKTSSKQVDILLQDLTPAQEAEVRARVEHLRPIVNTAFSQQDGDLEAGLMLSKQERMTDGSFTYRNTTKLPKGYGVRNLRSQGSRVTQTDPGLGTVIWQVHSADAFIAATSFIKHNALNVHDALIVGLNEVTDTARDLNQQTFEMLLNYSPAMEVLNATLKTVQGFAEYARESDVLDNPQVRELLQGALNKLAGKDETGSPALLRNVLRDMVRTAWKTEKVKLEALYQLHAVSQYTAEDGQYLLTAEDRLRITEAMKAFRNRQLPENLAADINSLVSLLEGEAVATTESEIEQQETTESAESQALIDNDADNREDSASEVESFVPDSPAPLETAEAMLAALENDRGMSPQALINVALQGATPAVAVLLERLAGNRFVDQVSVNIHDAAAADPGLFTRTTTAAGENRYQVDINLPWLKNRVWGTQANPVRNSAAETIAEVIAHELVHAATVEAVYDKGAAGKRVNARLQAIQGDIKAWMTQNPGLVEKLDETTRHQLQVMSERTSEIPTYGMTAKRIQEVLKRIPARQNSGSAWTRFVMAVREALGMRNSEATVLDEVISATDSILRSRPANPKNAKIELAINMGDQNGSPMRYTTRQIFDALASQRDVLPENEQRGLESLLEDIVGRLHGPSGAFHERARENEAVSAEDVFLKALASGQAPFVSASRAAGFALNDQQAFVLEQVEATIRASLEVAGTNDLARKELTQVWREAKAQIKPEAFHDGDWSQASSNDKALAQEKWDYVFLLDQGEGSRSDHLARFAALSMVYPALRQRMDFASGVREATTGETTLLQRLHDLFRRILAVFHERMTKTYAGQRADDKVWTLMDQLVDIEARRRARLTDRRFGWRDQVEEGLGDVGDAVRERLVEFRRSDFVQNSRFGAVRGAAGIVSAVAGERTDQMMNNIEEVRQRMFRERQGVMASLVSEARGAHDAVIQKTHALLRTLSKKNEQERVRLIDMARQVVLEGFSDNGRNLEREDKDALTRTIMDTDMVALMQSFDQEELTRLVQDKPSREQAIAQAEAAVKGLNSPWTNYYLAQARELGWHMATGNVAGEHLMLNAHNIAAMYGTQHAGQLSEADIAAATDLLDPLVSLYALDYTSPVHLERVGRIMAEETLRGSESGVLGLLQMHKRMQEDAREKLFNGEPVQMQKGYRAQIYDPYKTLTTVPMSEQATYEAMGYKLVERLPTDPHAPDQEPQGMFVLADGGMLHRVTGVVSYTNEGMRGTGIHGGVSSATSQGRFVNNDRKNQAIRQQRAAYIDQLVNHGAAHRPETQPRKSRLAPELAPDGSLVNYRYLMKQETKDNVLRRNNAFDDVIGAMAGRAFDKVASKEQNTTAIETMKEVFDAEYLRNPQAFLKVSADSTDPRMQEIYRLLPDHAKREIRRVWGDDSLWVRNDLIDVTFGYQKASAGNVFKLDWDERTALQKTLSVLFEQIFGRKAYLRARQTENFWQEIVKEVKDILVIKTGLTLAGNVISNFSLLLWHGVSPTDMARHHRVAFEGVLDYRRDHNQLTKLRMEIAIGRRPDNQETQQQIRELEDALVRNPVAFMIDEGLMPTIVEDVDLHDDPYSYKTALAEKMERWTGQVPKPLRTAGRYAYMTHDTPLYKAMSQGTQISDFVARYTLYQHLTTRKRRRMEPGEAIQRASDMFINYDIPTHRLMQYANDMGFLLFTKYYIRIQRAILTLYRENPAQSMMLMALNSMMPGLSLLTDSQAWDRIGNPIDDGAFAYPGALGELATVKAALSPFN